VTTQIATPPTETTQVRQRRRFTVAEYYAMAEAGILTEKDRVELLDGEIVVTAPIGNRHAFCVDWLNRFWILALAERAIVRIQNPVRLNDSSEPEPDITLLVWKDDFYVSGHPGPQDVLLLIEVADSTVDFDRNQKLQLYARAGITEVWIVNLQDRRVETYSEPEGDQYGNIRHYGPGESVSPVSFPDIALEVERIVPA
jgi:Uma2 family endonuclease